MAEESDEYTDTYATSTFQMTDRERVLDFLQPYLLTGQGKDLMVRCTKPLWKQYRIILDDNAIWYHQEPIMLD